MLEGSLQMPEMRNVQNLPPNASGMRDAAC
jgi:hypothetical protein